MTRAFLKTVSIAEGSRWCPTADCCIENIQLEGPYVRPPYKDFQGTRVMRNLPSKGQSCPEHDNGAHILSVRHEGVLKVGFCCRRDRCDMELRGYFDRNGLVCLLRLPRSQVQAAHLSFDQSPRVQGAE